MTDSYEVEFQITWNELYNLHRRLPNLRISQLMVAVTGIGLVVTALVLWFQQPDKAPLSALWGGAFIALAVAMPALSATGAWIRERRSLVLRLTCDGVCLPAYDPPNTIAWNHFNRFIETPMILAAVRGFTKQYVVIPKRVLHDDLMISRVRELMSSARNR